MKNKSILSLILLILIGDLWWSYDLWCIKSDSDVAAGLVAAHGGIGLALLVAYVTVIHTNKATLSSIQKASELARKEDLYENILSELSKLGNFSAPCVLKGDMYAQGIFKPFYYNYQLERTESRRLYKMRVPELVYKDMRDLSDTIDSVNTQVNTLVRVYTEKILTAFQENVVALHRPPNKDIYVSIEVTIADKLRESVCDLINLWLVSPECLNDRATYSMVSTLYTIRNEYPGVYTIDVTVLRDAFAKVDASVGIETRIQEINTACTKILSLVTSIEDGLYYDLHS